MDVWCEEEAINNKNLGEKNWNKDIFKSSYIIS